MTIGVVCAMEEEIRELLAVLDERQETVIAGQPYYSGKIEGVDVALVQCGIGKVQAGMNTAVLLERFKPDVVINTGSAGGIGDGLKVGDVVISSGVAYHDVNSTAFGYKPGQLPDQPQIFKADEEYVGKIQQAAAATNLTTTWASSLLVTSSSAARPQLRRLSPSTLMRSLAKWKAAQSGRLQRSSRRHSWSFAR